MAGQAAIDAAAIHAAERIEGMRTGTLVQISGPGRVLVDFAGNRHGPLAAGFAASLAPGIRSLAESGGPVLLVFADGDPRRPVIVDIVHDRMIEGGSRRSGAPAQDRESDGATHGRHCIIEAGERIELRCGRSSIVLTRAGKILIRGAYLLQRSSGANRIKGASVQIN